MADNDMLFAVLKCLRKWSKKEAHQILDKLVTGVRLESKNNVRLVNLRFMNKLMSHMMDFRLKKNGIGKKQIQSMQYLDYFLKHCSDEGVVLGFETGHNRCALFCKVVSLFWIDKYKIMGKKEYISFMEERVEGILSDKYGSQFREELQNIFKTLVPYFLKKKYNRNDSNDDIIDMMVNDEWYINLWGKSKNGPPVEYNEQEWGKCMRILLSKVFNGGSDFETSVIEYFASVVI